MIPRITSRVGCLQKMSTCNRRVQGDTEMNTFDKKVAVVTGASSSIGRETGGHLKPAEAPLHGPRARAHFPLPPLDIERPSIRGVDHPKFREIVHRDLMRYSAIEPQLVGFDAC